MRTQRTRYAAEGHTHAGGGYTAPTRRTVTLTTSSLASTARQQTTVTIDASYRVLGVSTDRPARVRLYSDATKQAADAGRAIGTDPTGDHGVQFDYVTTASVLSWVGAPPVDCVVASGTSVPITVDNKDSVTGTVTVTLTVIRTE